MTRRFYARATTSVTERPRLGNAWQRLLAFVLPAPCLACEQPVAEPRTSLGLCAACRRTLAEWPPGCRQCGQPLQGADLPPGYRCGPCRDSPPPFDRLLSRFSYQPPLEAVIHGLKFRRLDYLGRQLGEDLYRTLGAELEDIDLVTAIPLHWWRHLRRGYNQAWIIAQPVARALERPLVRLLRRDLDTSPQRRLKRSARLTNLRDAFRPRLAARLQGRKILLIDDVTTTGATMTAAASCLRRAGAGSILALTVARTPDQDQARWLAATPAPGEPEVSPKSHI